MPEPPPWQNTEQKSCGRYTNWKNMTNLQEQYINQAEQYNTEVAYDVIITATGHALSQLKNNVNNDERDEYIAHDEAEREYYEMAMMDEWEKSIAPNETADNSKYYDMELEGVCRLKGINIFSYEQRYVTIDNYKGMIRVALYTYDDCLYVHDFSNVREAIESLHDVQLD